MATVPASPQLENGFLRLSNELVEAMCKFGFSARQWSVLMFVIRKTYGWQGRKSDDISLSQIAEGTGLIKTHAGKTVRELVELNALVRVDGVHAMNLGLNKCHTEWGVTKTVTPEPKRSPLALVQQASDGVTKLVTGENPNESEVTKTVTPKSANGVTKLVSGGDQIGSLGVTDLVTTKERLKETTKRKPRAAAQTLQSFLDECKAKSEKPLPKTSPVWEYADGAKIPEDFIVLAWRKFKEKYTEPPASGKLKVYKDWRAAFRNCVKDSWFKLWFFDNNGTCTLTTVGYQTKQAYEAMGK